MAVINKKKATPKRAKVKIIEVEFLAHADQFSYTTGTVVGKAHYWRAVKTIKFKTEPQLYVEVTHLDGSITTICGAPFRVHVI